MRVTQIAQGYLAGLAVDAADIGHFIAASRWDRPRSGCTVPLPASTLKDCFSPSFSAKLPMEPLPVKAKSVVVSPAGTVTFSTVMVSSSTLVKVQSMVSPGASSTVAFKLSMSWVKVLVPSAEVQLMSPRCQSAAGSDSVSFPRAGLGIVDLCRSAIGQGAAVAVIRAVDSVAKAIRCAIGQRLLAHDDRAQLGVGEGAVGAAAGLRQADIGCARIQIAGDAHAFHGTVDGRQFVAGHFIFCNLVVSRAARW